MCKSKGDEKLLRVIQLRFFKKIITKALQNGIERTGEKKQEKQYRKCKFAPAMLSHH